MKVYLAMRNSDMTEGRGPMVTDKCFLKREHAENYIDKQDGVMGRKEKWSKSYNSYWEVRAIEVIEEDIIKKQEQKEQERQELIDELSDYELELLGIER